MNTDSSRLPTIRRAYFYLVALISLIVGLVAFNNLVRTLADVWIGPFANVSANTAAYARNSIAASAGFLVVATPLFLLHWGYARRRLTDEEELRSGMRKFFLYGATAAGLFVGFRYLFTLLETVLRSLLSRGIATDPMPATWLQAIVMILTGFALVAFWHTVVVSDGDYGREEGAAGAWRRILLTVVGLVAAALIIIGGAEVVRVLLQVAVNSRTVTVGAIWSRQLANGAALGLVGLSLGWLNWRTWSEIISMQPDEGRTGLRRLYLFGAILAGSLAVLVPAALVLRQLLILAFGEGVGTLVEMLTDLIEPLAFILPGAAVLWWHLRFLRTERSWFGESSESMLAGRIFRYLITAIGLGLLWVGAVELFQALIDLLFSTQGAVTAGRLWVWPLATGLSLLAVGVPVWTSSWRQVQKSARQDDDTGAQERGSGPRRVYLYGVALVSALLALFFVAQILYRFFLLLMGEPTATLWSSATANELARGAVAAAVWLYHVNVIRADGRMRKYVAMPATQIPSTRSELDARIAWLEAELLVARGALAALDAAQPSASAKPVAESP